MENIFSGNINPSYETNTELLVLGDTFSVLGKITNKGEGDIMFEFLGLLGSLVGVNAWDKHQANKAMDTIKNDPVLHNSFYGDGVGTRAPFEYILQENIKKWWGRLPENQYDKFDPETQVCYNQYGFPTGPDVHDGYHPKWKQWAAEGLHVWNFAEFARVEKIYNNFMAERWRETVPRIVDETTWTHPLHKKLIEQYVELDMFFTNALLRGDDEDIEKYRKIYDFGKWSGREYVDKFKRNFVWGYNFSEDRVPEFVCAQDMFYNKFIRRNLFETIIFEWILHYPDRVRVSEPVHWHCSRPCYLVDAELPVFIDPILYKVLLYDMDKVPQQWRAILYKPDAYVDYLNARYDKYFSTSILSPERYADLPLSSPQWDTDFHYVICWMIGKLCKGDMEGFKKIWKDFGMYKLYRRFLQEEPTEREKEWEVFNRCNHYMHLPNMHEKETGTVVNPYDDDHKIPTALGHLEDSRCRFWLSTAYNLRAFQYGTIDCTNEAVTAGVHTQENWNGSLFYIAYSGKESFDYATPLPQAEVNRLIKETIGEYPPDCNSSQPPYKRLEHWREFEPLRFTGDRRNVLRKFFEMLEYAPKQGVRKYQENQEWIGLYPTTLSKDHNGCWWTDYSEYGLRYPPYKLTGVDINCNFGNMVFIRGENESGLGLEATHIPEFDTLPAMEWNLITDKQYEEQIDIYYETLEKRLLQHFMENKGFPKSFKGFHQRVRESKSSPDGLPLMTFYQGKWYSNNEARPIPFELDDWFIPSKDCSMLEAYVIEQLYPIRVRLREFKTRLKYLNEKKVEKATHQAQLEKQKAVEERRKTIPELKQPDIF